MGYWKVIYSSNSSVSVERVAFSSQDRPPKVEPSGTAKTRSYSHLICMVAGPDSISVLWETVMCINMA